MPSPLRKCIAMGPAGTTYLPGDPGGSAQDYMAANNPQWFRDLRTNWIRLWADWPTIQPNNAPVDESTGNRNLTLLDQQISAARSNGLNVIVTSYRVPPWASGGTDNYGWPSFGVGQPWEHWLRFLYRRYKPSNPSGPKIQLLEIWNEPNMRYWQDTYTAQRMIDMFNCARRVSEEFDHELHIGGPALADREDADSNARYTHWATFHDRMKAIGFRAHSKFIWTHHNYSDVETTNVDGGEVNTNTTLEARTRINSWWTGYDEGDGPIVFATEGGGRLQYVGGSTDAIREDRQNRKTTTKFNALRGKAGIGMQTNYLIYDGTSPNAPLGYSGLRDPYPGGARPAFGGWANLDASGWGHVAGWGSEDLGPHLQWDCSVLSQHPGHVEVFAIGSDGWIYNNWQNWGPWSGWNRINGPWASGPGAISIKDGAMHLYVVGFDKQVYGGWWVPGAGWSNFYSIGGSVTFDPAVSSWSENHMEVFARWTDGTLHHKWWINGQGWSAWYRMSTMQVVGSPSAVSWADGRTDVVFQGTDRKIYHMFFNGTWNGPNSLGGWAIGHPEITSWKPGHLDILCGGSGDKIWRKTWDRAWSDWEPVANTGGFQFSPGAVSWGPGRIDMCFQRNNRMYHMWTG